MLIYVCVCRCVCVGVFGWIGTYVRTCVHRYVCLEPVPRWLPHVVLRIVGALIVEASLRGECCACLDTICHGIISDLMCDSHVEDKVSCIYGSQSRPSNILSFIPLLRLYLDECEK